MSEHVFETLLSALPHMIMLPLHSSLLQEVELFEAYYYGLVEQVHYLLTTGVNVNMTSFVSG